MAPTTGLWSPPAGMSSSLAANWRTFYRAALDKYGVTPADYRLMYVAQKGRCWVCRVAKGIHPDDPKGRGGKRLGIDHDHVTKRVRGLLCTGSLNSNTCNRLIAWYNRDQLRRAADYLTNPPARILEEMRHAEQSGNEAGISLNQTEIDRMAQDMLWMGEQ